MKFKNLLKLLIVTLLFGFALSACSTPTDSQVDTTKDTVDTQDDSVPKEGSEGHGNQIEESISSEDVSEEEEILEDELIEADDDVDIGDLI